MLRTASGHDSSDGVCVYVGANRNEFCFTDFGAISVYVLIHMRAYSNTSSVVATRSHVRRKSNALHATVECKVLIFVC